jgi:thiol-disulfide isomerase/thioredoxin
MCFGGKGMFQKKRKNIQRKSIRKKTGSVFLLSILLLVVLLSGCADKDQSGTSGTAEGEAAQGDAAHKGEDVQGAVSGTGEEENPGASVVFEGKDMEGNVISSDIFAQSRLTMINVWATYCNPCLREMPELAQLPDEYDAADFQLIGIISDLMEA